MKPRKQHLYIQCRKCELEQLYHKGTHNISHCIRCGSDLLQLSIFSGERG